MNKKIVLGLIAIVLIVGLGMYFKKDTSTSDYTVKIGALKGTIATIPTEFLKNTEILKESGLKYEIVDFASSNLLYEATVRGDVDAAPLVSLLPVLQNYHKQPEAVKVFGTFNLKVEDKYDYIMVKKDSPIKSLQDLSGKAVKFGAYPGTTQIAFTRIYLQKIGVDTSKIEFVQLAPSSHLQALESGSIDILATYDPIATLGVSGGNMVILDYSMYARDFDNTPLGVGLVNSKFAIDHPSDLKKFFKAYDKAYELISKDPELTYSTISSTYNLPLESAKTLALPTWNVSRDYDAKNFQKFIDHLVEIKELEKGFDTSTILIK